MDGLNSQFPIAMPAPETRTGDRQFADFPGATRGISMSEEDRLKRPPAGLPKTEGQSTDRAGEVDDPSPTLDTDDSGRTIDSVSNASSVEVAGGLSDYELLGELGRGGMGVVFKAREKRIHRIVALKMMLAGRFASPESIRRFRTEAEAVASLDHPNIVPIFHVAEANGLPYFTMKFIEGAPLDRQPENRFRPPLEAARLMSTLCRAVDYAHKRGILHRDLKPANILIDHRGEPHITDFGLAKRLGEEDGATQTGAVMGTPDYMSPEQAAGDIRKVSVASDVYSLGSILYHLLTGQPPFSSATVMETLVRVTREPVRAPTMLNRAIDPDLETICVKCLEKEPEQRYATAQDLADELQRYLDGEPITARPVGRFERARRWCRRNPAVAGLLAIVLILLVSWLVGLNAALVRISTEKEVAVENEAAAKAARDQARVNEAFAVQTLNDVIGSFHDGLRDRPGLHELRDELLFQAAEKLRDFQSRKELDVAQTADILRRTQIALHQRFGDALLASGRVEDALGEYEQMEALAREMHQEAPNRPNSNRFMASCANKLADALIRLGKLDQARDQYRRGLDYRKQWVRLLQQDPKTTAGALMNAKWDVSVSYLLLCGIDLQLGDLSTAEDDLEQSNPWAAAIPTDAEFQSAKDYLEMALRGERQADVAWRKGELDAARATYERSITLLQKGLGQERITKFRIQKQLADCLLSLGDLHLRLLQDAATAQTYYEQAGTIGEQLRAQDAQDIESTSLLAKSLYRQALAAQQVNDPGTSGRLFEQCLALRQGLVESVPQDVLYQVDLMMVLARCGQDLEAASIASVVEQRLAQPCGSLHAARCYAICAAVVGRDAAESQPARASRTDMRDEYLLAAQSALHRASERGWGDLRALETDPDLNMIDFQSTRADTRPTER